MRRRWSIPIAPDSSYPDTRLSGAGVAFKVAQLLLADAPDGPAFALGLADLAAIGSIADVVPLEGENRAITRIGLRLLAQGHRPGLAALLVSAGVSPDRVSPETISFALAPRINALGRVGHALDAALLLLEDDPDRIAELVARMEAANLERRGLMTAALSEARAALGDDDGAPVTIVAGPWAPGVVGLVAGRLADQLGRPAIVFSTTVDPWRGSARSAGGFDLGAAFAANASLFERHGGHAAAAGCHLDPARYDDFRAAMLACFTDAPPVVDRRRTLVLDLVTSAGSVDHVLLAELMPLDGVGDDPPLLGIAGLSVARVRAANGGHTQLTLRKGMEVLDGICFGRSDLVGQLREGDVVDVAARLVQPPVRRARDPPARHPGRRARGSPGLDPFPARGDPGCDRTADGRRRSARPGWWGERFGTGPPGFRRLATRRRRSADLLDPRPRWLAGAATARTTIRRAGAIPGPANGTAATRPVGRPRARAATSRPAAATLPPAGLVRVRGRIRAPASGRRPGPVRGVASRASRSSPRAHRHHRREVAARRRP